MDSDNDDAIAAGFTKQGGEALNLDDDGQFNDSEDADDLEDEDEMREKASGKKGDVKGKELENQPYDLAVDVNDSEEIESEEEEDEVNMNDVQRAAPQPAGAQTAGQQVQERSAGAGGLGAVPKRHDEDEDGDDDKDVPGTYNPADYANLNVSHEVKELFDYIARYKPQKVDLDTKLKPFIPDYIPAVGEVDACLKMPKPDG